MSKKAAAKRPAKKAVKIADDTARKDILRGLIKKTRFDKVRSLLEFNLQAGHTQDLQLPEGTVQIDDVDNSEAHSRIHMIVDSIVNQILTSGRPSVEVPKRSSSNIIYDEKNDLLLLGQETTIKAFHSLSSVTDITRLARVVQIIHDLLSEGIHGTKREVFYSDVDLFEEQGNSDAVIEDASALLRTTRNSTNIVASAKGVCIGRLRLRDRNDIIDCESLGSGGWGISPLLDNIEILESDAEFVLVVEKDAAVIRLTEDRWWKKYPCIIITAKGAADIATRMFLRRITKELRLPTFTLVDSDPYGHYIHSVYMRGSKRLSYETPFLATPNIHLLGVLARDLDEYKVPTKCRLAMDAQDIKRAKEMLDEEFIKNNKPWKEDLELMVTRKEKAEIQALSQHGFKYLTDEYLPTKMSTGDWI
jgi:meiotic recombination protein SPO11